MRMEDEYCRTQPEFWRIVLTARAVMAKKALCQETGWVVAGLILALKGALGGWELGLPMGCYVIQL